MASIFTLPRSTLSDADGNPIPEGTVEFFDAGTTTPKAVYSDSSLTTPILQPIEADSAGRLPKIYLATGSYKITVKDADAVVIYTEDNLDSGIPAGSGALAVLNGGTGATTASGARTNLGAAAQTDLDTISASVSAIEGQIDDVGGELGALAGKASITRTDLGSGFGIAVIQDTQVASTLSTQTITDTIPYDNSIPQNSEGAQILSGSFTPQSASSTLLIEVVAVGSAANTSGNVCLALFRDTGADAIAASWNFTGGTGAQSLSLKHRMASPGTSAVTFAARLGASTGNFQLNANSAGTRIGGGIVRAFLRVTEIQSY